jgi:DNA repair protein RadC
VNNRSPPPLVLPEALATHDLVALVAGAPQVAERVAGISLRDLATETPSGLRSLGVSLASARRLAGAFELGRRLATERSIVGTPVRVVADVFAVYGPRMRDLKVEQFVVLLVDAKARVRSEHLVSQGTLTNAPVNPREVFRLAIRHAAAGILVLHNHPSGDPEPSEDDIAITRRLTAAGELIGVKVLDHIVVGDGCYVSFLERGLIAPG